MLTRTLSRHGHRPILAADSRQGLLQQILNPADLVIIDVYMPSEDGLETMVELRQRFPALPIIAIAGRSAAPAMLAIAQTLGAVEVLQKPFGAHETLAAVKRSLRPETPRPSAQALQASF